MRLIFILFISFFIVFISCDDSINLNDEWSDNAIVYGVLDPSDTAHYIRINKAFLGEGNAYEMAKESDSVQYATELDVRLLEFELTNNELDPFYEGSWKSTGRTIVLSRTNEIKKDTNGDFGTGVNYLYKTTEALKELHKYVLEIKVPGKSEIVKAETFLIGGFYVEIPRPNIDGVSKTYIHTEKYLRPISTEFRAATYGKVYELTIRFKYLEFVGTDTTEQFVDLTYPSKTLDYLRMPSDFKGADMKQIYGGADFYYKVGKNIPQKENVKRIALGLDFVYDVGGEALSTYLSSSASGGVGSSGLNYSTIINGRGIFAARYSYKISNLLLYGEAVDSLAYGEYTKHLNFANYQGAWK